MSITYAGSSANLTSNAFRGGCTNESTNEVIIVEDSSSTLRRYSLSSFSQVGSNVSLTSAPCGVCMISTASALVHRNSSSNIDLVELSTGYKQSYTTSAGTFTQTRPQSCASDISNKIAFLASSVSTGTITKFNGNTFTSTTYTQAGGTFFCGPSEGVSCVIYKSANRFLLGTTKGRILEIDENANIVDKMLIFKDDVGPSTNSSVISTNVTNLSYSGDFILAYTSGGDIVLLDWTTKKILHKHIIENSQTGICICDASSGITLVAKLGTVNALSNGMVSELDFTIGAVQVRDNLYTDSVGGIIATGINTQTGRGWAIQTTTNKIRFFDISRSVVNHTVTTPSNANARIAILDETAGQGLLKKVVDTFTTSPRTFLLEPGKDYMELIGLDNGTSTTWNMSRFST